MSSTFSIVIIELSSETFQQSLKVFSRSNKQFQKNKKWLILQSTILGDMVIGHNTYYK